MSFIEFLQQIILYFYPKSSGTSVFINSVEKEVELR